ncbi:MAG: heptaprenyl diphosphate synthase [Syntrophomonadaceae bacterium]|nr:heptaprenyl diphosphate synthase [Syntrophomonadaceae bacterium]
MQSHEFFTPIKRELQIMEEELIKAVDTNQPLLKQASGHLIHAGGKRLRPAFVLLTGSCFTSKIDHLIPMAVAMELVHMATLVHDDVIDNSMSRRGRDTVKARFGNRMSIYSGDYMLAKALHKVGEYCRADLMKIVTETSVKVCQGEIVQLQSAFDVDQGITDYLRRIERKTALLISVACQVGALLAGASPPMVRAMRRFGHYLGMSFQITDDILDFTADESVLGKPTGSDIRQGIITLPALYALRYSPEASGLRAILSSPDNVARQANRAISIINRSGGIEYSQKVAEKYINKAQLMLEQIPSSQARTALSRIADFVCTRDY